MINELIRLFFYAQKALGSFSKLQPKLDASLSMLLSLVIRLRFFLIEIFIEIMLLNMKLYKIIQRASRYFASFP